MKDGLIYENGELIYYENGTPKHAGIVKVGKDIYYISSKGRAVRGEHVVHTNMANGIIKSGTYTFGDDFKLVKGSRVAPKRQKKKKKRKPLSKKTKMWICIVSAVVLAVLVAFIAYENATYEHKPRGNALKPENETVLTDAEIVLPKFDEPILLCSSAAKDLYDNKIDILDAVGTSNPYRPMRFEYLLKGEAGELRISENKDMSDSRVLFLEPSANFVEIDNLKTGTHYYYTVDVGESHFDGEFETEESTRFVKIPGTVNTRDIGGYYNLDGKKVRQGLLIRGVEIDGLVEPQYYIPKKDIAAVQETFGFVYDFDLREESLYTGSYQSPLGEKVLHSFYTSPQYGQIFNSLNAARLRNIFSNLADPEKYPMYLHCTYGTDRTGTIIYLLQGILNMSSEDMEREYKMTGFLNRAVASSTNIEVVETGMNAFEGDTLQEKIESFLTDFVGVTDEEIESIREIFLED